MEDPNKASEPSGSYSAIPKIDPRATTYYTSVDVAPAAQIIAPAAYSNERVLYSDSYNDDGTVEEAPKQKGRGTDLARSGSPVVASTAPDEKGTFTWNDKFQLLLDSLPTEFLSSEADFAPVASFCWDLLRLSKDFVHLASLYGKIIISEKALAEQGMCRCSMQDISNALGILFYDLGFS